MPAMKGVKINIIGQQYHAVTVPCTQKADVRRPHLALHRVVVKAIVKSVVHHITKDCPGKGSTTVCISKSQDGREKSEDSITKESCKKRTRQLMGDKTRVSTVLASAGVCCLSTLCTCAREFVPREKEGGCF